MLIYRLFYRHWQVTVEFVVAEVMADKGGCVVPQLPGPWAVAETYVTLKIPWSLRQGHGESASLE